MAWPAQPGVSPEAGLSLGWGALVPMVFFADAYRTSRDSNWLEMAERGAHWLRAKLASPDREMRHGLFTGLVGFAVVFNELARVSADVTADLASVFELLAGAATETDNGLNWSETPRTAGSHPAPPVRAFSQRTA
jgi:hypothetical protein